MQSLTDEHLMQQVQQGALRHAGLLFERYQKPLYGYFMNVLNNVSDAEDATQATFSRLLKYRSSYDVKRKFSGWLFSIAVNQRNSLLKLRIKESSRIEQSEQPEFIDESTTNRGINRLQGEQAVNAINQALKRLPIEQRELLSLYLWQERNYQELACIFEVKTGAIRVRVHRALTKLKNELSTLGRLI